MTDDSELFCFEDGHKPGIHLRRRDLIYVHIPKCGSTGLVRVTMNEMGFVFRPNIRGVLPKRGFAVIRNPLNRFSSGIVEYFIRHLSNENHLEEWLPWAYKEMEKGEMGLVHDEHTQPQWQFLAPFERIPMTLIPLLYIQSGLEQFFSDTDIHVPRIEQANETLRWRTSLSTELLTPGLVARINDYYKQDWALYQSVVSEYV